MEGKGRNAFKLLSQYLLNVLRKLAKNVSQDRRLRVEI